MFSYISKFYLIYSRTPLYYVYLNKNSYIAQLLLSKGSNINFQDKYLIFFFKLMVKHQFFIL